MKTISLIILATFAVAFGYSQGAYLEYKLTSESKAISGLFKIYYQDGSARTEMKMDIPQMPGGGMNIVTLNKKDDPKKVYMLNDDKTYTTMDMDKLGGTSAPDEDYDITVVGKEKVNGYNSTHVIIKSKTITQGQDMWLSTEIPNYEKYKGINTKFTSAKLFQSLKAKGADGFMVRIKMSQQGQNIQMDITKAEAKTNPATMFSLDGYTESTTSSPLQDMIQKIQNMTPEERQKMMDQMQQQYNQPH